MYKEKLNDLKVSLDSLIRIVERVQVEREVKEKEIIHLQMQRDTKKQLKEIYVQVAELFKQLGGQQQETLIKEISRFVNFGLRNVFGNEYTFIADIRVDTSNVTVDFRIKTADVESPLIDAKGGGVVEVVSILLQIFFLIVLKSTLTPVLILDTALIHLSDEYHSKMSRLLSQLCQKFDIQIILFTHSGEYGDCADKLYRFYQIDGRTQVEVSK